MKQRILPIITGALGLGLLFNWFFYDHQLGLNYFLYVVIVLALTAGYMRQWRQKITPAMYVLGGIALLCAGFVVFRASGFVQFMNIVASLYALSLIALLAWRPQSRLKDFTSFDYFNRVIHLPFATFRQTLTIATRGVSYGKQGTELQRHQWLPVIRGVIISVPILLVFVLLFAAADDVFKYYLDAIFNFQLSPEFIGRTILILLVSTFFLAIYTLLYTHSDTHDRHERPSRIPKLGSVEANIVLGSVSFLFFLFVVIQLQYLFGGQSNVLSAGGFTYAEYARKGFFEMMLIAVIVFALVHTLYRKSVHKTLQQQFTFKFLSVFLIAEVGLVMVSAHKRLSLLEEAYGFTSLRLYSHIFIFWLAIALAILVVYILRSMPRQLFARSILGSALAVLIFINMLNPDAFIAERNFKHYQQSGRFDSLYLYDLSDDAVELAIPFINVSDKRVANNSALALKYRLTQLSKPHSWLEYNVSRDNAHQQLERYRAQLEVSRTYIPPNAVDKDLTGVPAYDNL